MSKAVAFLKEYKEILIILAALGGVATVAPRREQPVTLEGIGAKLDSMSRQLEGLVRVQCTENRQLSTIAGVRCP